MAHCYICDFSETVTSSLYASLHGVDPTGNKVLFDEKIDKYVCADCIGASLANYRSLEKKITPPKQAGEVEFELESFDDDADPWRIDSLELGEGATLPVPFGGSGSEVTE